MARSAYKDYRLDTVLSLKQVLFLSISNTTLPARRKDIVSVHGAVLSSGGMSTSR